MLFTPRAFCGVDRRLRKLLIYLLLSFFGHVRTMIIVLTAHEMCRVHYVMIVLAWANSVIPPGTAQGRWRAVTAYAVWPLVILFLFPLRDSVAISSVFDRSGNSQYGEGFKKHDIFSFGYCLVIQKRWWNFNLFLYFEFSWFFPETRVASTIGDFIVPFFSSYFYLHTTGKKSQE